MAKVMLLRHYGGPEMFEESDIPLQEPGPGEVHLRQTAIGVNYHDVYVRSGLYRTLDLPGVAGIEAVGVVEAIGSGVDHISPGDRIGYVTGAYGAYASERILSADLAIPIPDFISDTAAAASLMKALTVCMLIRHVYALQAGQVILVHAAAGGVGQLLCQWASHLGATVIGTVGSEEKAAVARAAGAAHVILYRKEDVAARIADITGGVGVSVAYDSVGADTFQNSLNSLAYQGHLINFGQSSGPVAPFTPSALAGRSLSVSRPILFHYLRTAEQRRMLVNETIKAFDKKVIRPIEPIAFPMEQVAQAHRTLESRKSPGGVVLLS